MRSKARVTARDVARLAGVSQSTVSYVLNRTPNQTISEATRARVLHAAEELRYAPSAAARALRLGSSQIVFVILPDAPIGSTIAQLIEQLTDLLEPHGYSVVYRRHRGAETLERFLREVSPAVVADLAALTAQETERIAADGIPVVNAAVDRTGAGQLAISEARVGRLQAAHLVERGHRRLGYAASPDPRVDVFLERRLVGVREVCAAAGLPDPQVVAMPLDVAAATAAIAELWAAPPDERVTAVCAYNDEQAFALLAGMRVLGLRAPADLAVIGVDNVPLAPFADPPLTTIDIHVERITEVMAAMVLDAVAGREAGGSVWTPATLVRRDSA